MQNSPVISALGAGVVIFATKFAAMAASAATETAAAATDWPALIEKAGTVGVLIWMVVWFQKRLEAKDLVVQQITQDLIKAVDRLADSQNTLAKAVTDLRPK